MDEAASILYGYLCRAPSPIEEVLYEVETELNAIDVPLKIKVLPY